MSASKKYGLYAVEIAKAVPVVVGGVVDENINLDTEVRSEAVDGQPYSRFQTVPRQGQTVRCTTVALKSWFDQIGVLGLDISTITNGINFWTQQFAEAGLRTSGANHRKYNVVDGLFLPRRLSVDDNSADFQAEFECLVSHDGSSNDPVLITDSQSVPALPTDDERFGMGPITFTGPLAIDNVTGWDLDFGINAVLEAADGDVLATFPSIETIAPVLNIRTRAIDLLKNATDIKMLGTALTHAATKLYLRRRISGGAYELDATAKHIKLTIDGHAVVQDAVRVTRSTGSEMQISIPLRYDGTLTPIVITTDTAIT